MIASDVADLYVGAREGESFAQAAQEIERAFRLHGWTGRVIQGPPLPSPFADAASPCHAVVLDPVPTRSVLANGASVVRGGGRVVRMLSFDIGLDRWRVTSTERGSRLAGLTLHHVMDGTVAMQGSLFAIVDGGAPTSLYFGASDDLVDLLRRQGPAGRASLLICERVCLTRCTGAPGKASLLGTIDLEGAPPGSVIALVSEMAARTRLVANAFTDVRAAQAALDASNVTSVVLLARIVEQTWLD